MRTILHCDANGFYASCELSKRPALRGLPVSVGGDPDKRHGIVLASSQEAKQCGVKTGMALWQARQVCPSIIFVPPNFDLYISISRKLRRMYEEYSPQVESLGLDECWLDITSRGITLEDGRQLANTLRERVKNELNITLSVGVSWNKIFAKLGSDMKKPDATTVISRENYRDIVWPLPVADLFFIGPKTTAKLVKRSIFTIGDLATTNPALLRAWFGKTGTMHSLHARGEDRSPVMTVGFERAIKSIGNSTTTPRDITSVDDVKNVYTLLADSVGRRLREAGMMGRCIIISVRDSSLHTTGCQRTIDYFTSLSDDILETAMSLFMERGYEQLLPLRSVGVSVSSLVADAAPQQMDLFGDMSRRIKLTNLATTIDNIRQAYGTQIIQRGNVMDSAFGGINPHDDHTVHPMPFFFG